MKDLATLELGGSTVVLRRAEAGDIPAIVDLLAADQLGATRDGVNTAQDLAAYQVAFRAIDADPAHVLVVAQAGQQLVGTLQLSFIPGLARRGALRAQIEAVRVHESYRSRGLGAAMMGWAIEEARRRGCGLVQLTTDKARPDAHRFYERLGFVASHQGMKLRLLLGDDQGLGWNMPSGWATRRATLPESSSSNSAVTAGWPFSPNRRPRPAGSSSKGGAPGMATVSTWSPRRATTTSIGPMT
jgi:GNAT superfamily N-acetyltransferase